jgi:NCAIR mutase (PurE)-related protein
MDKSQTLKLLQDIEAGKISAKDALLKMQIAPYENLGHTCIDLHRGIRQGHNEVIYGLSKTPEQILDIIKAMTEKGLDNILITHLSKDAVDLLESQDIKLQYYLPSKTAVVCPKPVEKTGNIIIASAGTSDLAVSQEAQITAETFGNAITVINDVGVSGIHRLLSRQELLAQARVIIAIAGMEGALPSVIAGLVSCPVIAVPTSIGYGANFGGLSALLAMLNSCANGIAVVNIDNGFGAAYMASLINKMEAR